MKRSITLISLLLAASGPTLAEQVVAQNPGISTAFKSNSADVTTCVNMFIARIFPGQIVSTGAKLNSTEWQSISDQKLTAVWVDQEITMFARLKQDNSRLAIGSCSISGNGRVISVSVRTNSVMKLARLQPNDVQLSMTAP